MNTIQNIGVTRIVCHLTRQNCIKFYLHYYRYAKYHYFLWSAILDFGLGIFWFEIVISEFFDPSYS